MLHELLPLDLEWAERSVRTNVQTNKNGKANVLGFVLQTNDDEIMNGKAVRWVAPGF